MMRSIRTLTVLTEARQEEASNRKKIDIKSQSAESL